MGKQQKRDVMGKIYRQFSRQKYNKYKHQYPKMRQSEIVSKIIRQWDSLDLGAKQKLKKQYEQNKILTTQDFSESQLAKKNEEVLKRLQRRTTAKKEQAAEEEAIEAQIIKERKLQKKLEDNKQIKAKRQNIQKNTTFKFKSTDYITFFRHYYEKHRQEHPRWTSSQISKIIQLMWKKNKTQKKVSSKLSKEKLQRTITKTKKIVSGRAAFKKFKSLNSSNVSTLWKHLPIESKKYWQIEAQGKARQVVRQQKIVLRGGLQNDQKPFEFLSKMIV